MRDDVERGLPGFEILHRARVCVNESGGFEKEAEHGIQQPSWMGGKFLKLINVKYSTLFI